MRPQDRQLGPGEIILVELADLVEERGADLIVKILARDFLLRTPEAMDHVLHELPAPRDRLVVAGNRGMGWCHSSFASRIPVNCQRDSGGKKFRYVARMWVAGVAHEPPRSTS